MGLCLTWSEAVRVAVDCFSSVVDGDASAWQYNDLLHLSRLRSAAPALQALLTLRMHKHQAMIIRP